MQQQSEKIETLEKFINAALFGNKDALNNLIRYLNSTQAKVSVLDVGVLGGILSNRMIESVNRAKDRPTTQHFEEHLDNKDKFFNNLKNLFELVRQNPNNTELKAAVLAYCMTKHPSADMGIYLHAYISDKGFPGDRSNENGYTSLTLEVLADAAFKYGDSGKGNVALAFFIELILDNDLHAGGKWAFRGNKVLSVPGFSKQQKHNLLKLLYLSEKALGVDSPAFREVVNKYYFAGDIDSSMARYKSEVYGEEGVLGVIKRVGCVVFFPLLLNKSVRDWFMGRDTIAYEVEEMRQKHSESRNGQTPQQPLSVQSQSQPQSQLKVQSQQLSQQKSQPQLQQQPNAQTQQLVPKQTSAANQLPTAASDVTQRTPDRQTQLQVKQVAELQQLPQQPVLKQTSATNQLPTAISAAIQRLPNQQPPQPQVQPETRLQQSPQQSNMHVQYRYDAYYPTQLQQQSPQPQQPLPGRYSDQLQQQSPQQSQYRYDAYYPTQFQQQSPQQFQYRYDAYYPTQFQQQPLQPQYMYYGQQTYQQQQPVYQQPGYGYYYPQPQLAQVRFQPPSQQMQYPAQQPQLAPDILMSPAFSRQVLSASQKEQELVSGLLGIIKGGGQNRYSTFSIDNRTDALLQWTDRILGIISKNDPKYTAVINLKDELNNIKKLGKF